MIEIGSAKINTNIILAPLAGCADLAFRLISREHGAKFCFFEMVDANSLVHGPGKNRDILKTDPADQPIAAQILGGDPEVTLEAAKVLLSRAKPLFLDLNAACPARKVLKKNAGAHLVRDPELLAAIIKKLAASLSLPVTVKLRAGFHKSDHEYIASVARKCEQSGAAAIFIHGRTQKQLYSGKVDYESIKRVKENVAVPVIGSGDILSPELAKEMFDQTGCDGILVARGAIGNPWIFERIESFLKSGRVLPAVNLAERKKVLKKHLQYMDKFKESRPTNKVGLMRRITIEYLKGLPAATEIRRRITPQKSLAGLLELVDSI